MSFASELTSTAEAILSEYALAQKSLSLANASRSALVKSYELIKSWYSGLRMMLSVTLLPVVSLIISDFP